MLRFFRQIRQKLLTANKFCRYRLYFEYANVLNMQYWRMTRTWSFFDTLKIQTRALDSFISKELK